MNNARAIEEVTVSASRNGSSAPERDEHRAVAAWRALGTDRRVPSAVETVRAKKPTGRCVYRLLDATDEGDSVIAKRYRSAVHDIDRAFYQEVLPLLPVSTPRFYGEVDDGDGYVWIFLEDAGRQRFSPRDPEHRVLAARWLGTMHTAAPELPFRDRLPERGLQQYRHHLEEGRRLILDNLDNPALRPDETALLGSIVGLCDTVERRWEELEESCAAAPATLVHGDFRPRNVFVREAPGTREGQRLLVIDWEMAGWGVSAADLAPKRGQPQVDLDTYCHVVREHWPEFDLRFARRLMWAGLIIRRLAAIEWAAMSLRFPQPEALEDPIARLRIYHEELSRALEDALLGVPA
jgi:aminoglycoside phosphotransferase (APT) family kinase protein